MIKQFKAKDKPEQKPSNSTNEHKTDIATNKPFTSKKQAKKKYQRSLKTLRNFSRKQIHCTWFDSDILLFALEGNRFKAYHTDPLARILSWAADLIFRKHDEDYFSKLFVIQASKYALDNNYNPGPTPAEFDDYLFRLADVVWPHPLASFN